MRTTWTNSTSPGRRKRPRRDGGSNSRKRHLHEADRKSAGMAKENNRDNYLPEGRMIRVNSAHWCRHIQSRKLSKIKRSGDITNATRSNQTRESPTQITQPCNRCSSLENFRHANPANRKSITTITPGEDFDKRRYRRQQDTQQTTPTY